MNSSPHSNVHVLHHGAAAPRLHQMAAGQLFRAAPHADRVLARLTHAQLDVADATTIWCVVIAAKADAGVVPGELCPLPRDAIVESVRVVEPLRLARAEH